MRPLPAAAWLVALAVLAPHAAPRAQAPTIASVSPAQAESPGIVTVQGTGFDATTTVTIDGIPAAVVAVTPTQLDVTPPALIPGFGDVLVTNASGSALAPDAAVLWPALSAVEGGLNGTVDLTLWNGQAGLVTYAFAFGVSADPVFIDPSIYYGLLLDLSGTFGVLTSSSIPAGGTDQLSLPIGPDPSVLGATIGFQAFAAQGVPTQDLAFSNAATVTIGASVPPMSLAYPVDPMVLTPGIAAAPNTPTVQGWVESWSVTPALPAGLTLDPTDGTIAGTPVAGGTTSHTVTAANPAGSATTTLGIQVDDNAFRIEAAANGLGQLLPHRVLDSATLQTFDVTTLEELDLFLAQGFDLQPAPIWPTAAVLPDGNPGNHFLVVRFSEPIDVDSVLDPSLSGAAQSHLTGALTVTALDPVTGAITTVPGQPFIDGRTYGGSIAGTSYVLEPWVQYDPFDLDGDGFEVEPLAVGASLPGLGFPGTETAPFAGLDTLFGPDTFVFVFDADSLLASHETAPTGVTVRIQISGAVRSASGKPLEDAGVITLTVGPDTFSPEVLLTGGFPQITPGNGDLFVDPETDVTIRFSESIDIASLGATPSSGPAGLSAAAELTFGDPSQPLQMPFRVLPVSPFDLSQVVLLPSTAFPGDALTSAGCADYGRVDVDVNAFGPQDLEGNAATQSASTFFETGFGQGLVNAPIAPDSIYVGRTGPVASLSVVDLNGFGGGTGYPDFDPSCPIGSQQSDFPNNPNVSLQGTLMVPPLGIGSCPVDGGSDGALTLTVDSSLDDRLLRGAIQSLDDMALGHSLDVLWNNGNLFACTAFNPCAQAALKIFNAGLVANTLVPADGVVPAVHTVVAGENPISWAPTPNPPPLTEQPSCAESGILGLEPTSVDTGLFNLLAPGAFPFGNPALCIPPSSLLSPEQNAFFVGPSPESAAPLSCSQYAFRQQIGHFLYAVDGVAGELVVLNSNRMTVIDRIELPDPTRLAMAPGLDFLAVTNEDTDSVSFIDVDPTSTSFHQVVQEVAVGDGPTGIAWESGNEDILVCNTGDGTVSVISAFSLTVRKTLTGFLTDPFEVVTTPRQQGIGLNRNVYYAWILNANGDLTLFESGPDGINGWGYDDCIGVAPFELANPLAMQADPRALSGAVWVAHRTPLDPATGAPSGTGPALTKVRLDAVFFGQQPLIPGSQPNLRDHTFVIEHSLDGTVLTGRATDLAFDNLRNLGSLPDRHTSFSAGSPLPMNGKGLVKSVPLTGAIENANEPTYLFLAVPNSTEGAGVIDVIDLATLQRLDADPFAPGVQSIQAPGARVLMDYFRQ